tara:strand:- start:146 stop:481 length:336 start_codon:yes stop_codon:yes gene_type:complete
MFQPFQQQSFFGQHNQKRSTSSRSAECSGRSPAKSQLFWITLAVLANMALLMTAAYGHSIPSPSDNAKTSQQYPSVNAPYASQLLSHNQYAHAAGMSSPIKLARFLSVKAS